MASDVLVMNEPEMTPFESAFILKLLQAERPVKVLEVGVSAGGTTALLLEELLKLHGSDGKAWQMFSVDRSERWYRGGEQRSGFMADALIRERQIRQHRFLLGDVLPAFLPDIGDGIDFVVLDTMHTLPGELLDFLCMLPYLRDGAVVCLHDVNLHHVAKKIAFSQNQFRVKSVATNVLLHSVAGEHIIPELHDELGRQRLANIGAFRITQETRKEIVNVFLALSMPWAYMPGAKDLLSYSRFLKDHYDEMLFRLYKTTIREQDFSRNHVQMRFLKTNAKIVIYGAGSCGRSYYEYLREPRFQNEVILVDQKAAVWKEILGLDVLSPDDVQWGGTFDQILISIASFATANQVYQALAKKVQDPSVLQYLS